MKIKACLPMAAIGLFVFVVVGACQKEPPPKPTPPASLTEPAANTQSATESTEGESGSPATSASLPSNHPPVGRAGGSEASALPPGHPPLGGAAMAAAAPEALPIAYDAPADWKSEPVTSQMRKAQFMLPRAEGDKEDGRLVVFYFGPGEGGTVENNIDRWANMFTTDDGQPVPDSAVKREMRENNGLKVTTLDVAGRYADPMAGRASASSEPWRMLSAIVETPNGPWFFKAVGPAATMKRHEKNFAGFVESIKPATAPSK